MRDQPPDSGERSNPAAGLAFPRAQPGRPQAVLADEFLQYSRTCAPGNADESIGKDQICTAIRVGIVRVRERARTHSPEEIRIVRHEMSAVTAGNKCVTQRMIEA